MRTERDEVTAFAEALGLPADLVPLTFPIRWLALPPVRAAIEGAIGRYPVHASQTFTPSAALVADTDYVLQVTIKPQRAPAPRIAVRSVVTDCDGRAVVQFETVLLPTSAIAAAPLPQAYDAGAGSLPDIEIGQIDEAQAARYAAATHDDSRLHRDADFARSFGLDGPIIHGMLLMGLFQKALAEWSVGSNVSRLYALFTRPVPVGSKLTISGRKVASAKGQILRLFVRDEGDRIACIGEAALATEPQRP